MSIRKQNDPNGRNGPDGLVLWHLGLIATLCTSMGLSLTEFRSDKIIAITANLLTGIGGGLAGYLIHKVKRR